MYAAFGQHDSSCQAALRRRPCQKCLHDLTYSCVLLDMSLKWEKATKTYVGMVGDMGINEGLEPGAPLGSKTKVCKFLHFFVTQC